MPPQGRFRGVYAPPALWISKHFRRHILHFRRSRTSARIAMEALQSARVSCNTSSGVCVGYVSGVSCSFSNGQTGLQQLHAYRYGVVGWCRRCTKNTFEGQQGVW